jgi:hypothetical protein
MYRSAIVASLFLASNAAYATCTAMLNIQAGTITVSPGDTAPASRAWNRIYQALIGDSSDFNVEGTMVVYLQVELPLWSYSLPTLFPQMTPYQVPKLCNQTKAQAAYNAYINALEIEEGTYYPGPFPSTMIWESDMWDECFQYTYHSSSYRPSTGEFLGESSVTLLECPSIGGRAAE